MSREDTMRDLLAFAKGKDPDIEYEYGNPYCCALAQYWESLGMLQTYVNSLDTTSELEALAQSVTVPRKRTPDSKSYAQIGTWGSFARALEQALHEDA